MFWNTGGIVLKHCSHNTNTMLGQGETVLTLFRYNVVTTTGNSVDIMRIQCWDNKREQCLHNTHTMLGQEEETLNAKRMSNGYLQVLFACHWSPY